MSINNRLSVAVLGAGGIGSKIGGILAETQRADVWLIARNEKHVHAVNENGLSIRKNDEERQVSLRATTNLREIGEVDFIIVTVKAYDTLPAARSAIPLLGPETLVITFQNGLGNLEILSEEFGNDRCVLGVTFQGATLLGPGRVADMGGGLTFVATNDKTEARLKMLSLAYSSTTVPMELRSEEEIDGLLWGKLSMVSGFNPLAAVLRIPNGAFGEIEEAHSLSVDAISETMAVAKANGVTLAFDPLERFEATSRATAKMSSGTLIDVLRGRKTEIDAISGAISREGKRLGVPTPIHNVLSRLGRAIEATYKQRVFEITVN